MVYDTIITWKARSIASFSAASERAARELYPDSSLADLYDEVLMPKELREAHRANDRAVMRAYGFPIKMTEADCVAALMQRYEQLTAGK